MFDEMTYEKLLGDMIADAPEDIDTREGSIFYDAVAAFALRLAEAYVQTSILYNQLQLRTANGEALDLKGDEHITERGKATQAEYGFIFTGTAPPAGAVFYSESGLYFTLLQRENIGYYLQSNEDGAVQNEVSEGSVAIPVESYPELTSASFGELLVAAVDEENDEEYRQSIYKALSPGENGNIQHYKNWCKIDGVDHARVIPCYYGPNTVLGIIIAADGTPASEELVRQVQKYVDPEGAGPGEGVANIGAHFTAIAPMAVDINVNLTELVLVDGYTDEQAQDAIKAELSAYFKRLSLSTDTDTITVKASVVGAAIQDISCVDSYGTIDFTYSGERVSIITLGVIEIPVCGAVNII